MKAYEQAALALAEREARLPATHAECVASRYQMGALSYLLGDAGQAVAHYEAVLGRTRGAQGAASLAQLQRLTRAVAFIALFSQNIQRRMLVERAVEAHAAGASPEVVDRVLDRLLAARPSQYVEGLLDALAAADRDPAAAASAGAELAVVQSVALAPPALDPADVFPEPVGGDRVDWWE